MNLDEFVDILNSNKDVADKLAEIQYKIQYKTEQNIISIYNNKLLELCRSIPKYENSNDSLRELIFGISRIMSEMIIMIDMK